MPLPRTYNAHPERVEHTRNPPLVSVPRSFPALAAVAAGCLAAYPAAAQPVHACPDGVVAEIFIDNGSVFDVGSPELDARFNWAYRTANRLHVRTRQRVIRREMLFREGECFVPALLEDSERILRSLSFIADADVFAVPQPDGNYHVVVDTRDEWSFRVEPEVDSDDRFIAGFELREDNLLGTGHRIAGYTRRQHGERVYGAEVASRQLFGTHLDAELGVARTPTGVSLVQRLAYPFRGETGRWAYREQVEHLERNFVFYLPLEGGGVERRFFAEERQAFDVGAMFRLGRRGNLTLIGVGITGERVAYPRDVLTGGDDGDGANRQTEPAEPVSGLDTLSSVRFVVLTGQRNVWFVRRRALDAVRGTEDVRLGLQTEMSVGRSLNAFSDDDDLAVDLGFAAAGYLPGGILGGVWATLEGNRDFDAEPGEPEWRNVFGQLDAWAYYRTSEASRHTWVAAVSAAGGWRTRIPFQLTLGSRSGLRGLPRHAYPGERRAVGTLEHRAYLGWPYPRLFDLGTAAFVDVGKMWVGGDAFGMISPLEASVGVGLRLAFPPGSRRTDRVDVAMPVTGGVPGHGVQVTFGIGQAIGRGSERDDPQLRRSSRRTLSASVFTFPQ